MKQYIKKKWTIRQVILTILSNIGDASLDILDQGFLNPKYSFTHTSRALIGLPIPNYERYTRYTQEKRKAIFSATLSQLKKDGLVAATGQPKKSMWGITKYGKTYLQKTSKNYTLPPVDNQMRLVIFDIPEKERKKRDRIRTLLLISDYKQLQRSVWIGERPLPEFTFHEIADLGLKHYTHVFEIKNKGSIPKSIFQKEKE